MWARITNQSFNHRPFFMQPSPAARAHAPCIAHARYVHTTHDYVAVSLTDAFAPLL